MTRVDDMLAYTAAELGKPYVFGDEGPNTFDCSGLVQWVLGKVGIKAPRIAAQQQQWATPVDDPRPGDLVFFGAPAHHVGIYIGAGHMIDAPHTGAKVRIDTVRNPTNYGRVPGLGSGLGIVTGAVGGVLGGVLGGARHVVVEAIAAAAGLGLAVAGIWLLTKRRRTA